MKNILNNIRIVLVHTTHPGNIGAAARAMKTMGLQNLYLVQPKVFPDEIAMARAKQAEDILNNAVVVDSLAEAIADCTLVLGTSARPRNLAWPTLTAAQAGERVIQEANNQQVALVFGRERTGLTNEELQQCHYQLHIPANPDYSSLNLAAAVQVVAYEVYHRYISTTKTALANEPTELANTAELAGLYEHLTRVLTQIDYLDPEQPGHIIPRLQRLYNRARLDKVEINILRGILTAVQKKTDS